MKRIFLLTFLSLILGCSHNIEPNNPSNNFRSELKELKTYFQIPGLAAVVQKDGKIIYESYDGYSDIAKETSINKSTLFPIASLTKIFSAILILQLEEEGKLSLDDPINAYLSQSNLSDSIQIQHILSHTSQGDVGEQFFYSSRFGALTRVIEQTSGMSFEQLLNDKILTPLKLSSTFLLKDSTQVLNRKTDFASPYVLDKQIEPGFIDYGYSSSTGIVSNTKDLLILSNAIDKNKLIRKSSKERMFSPFQKNLPYGLGIFNKRIENHNIHWGYGQYDCYSSLLLKVPSKNLSLILLANNNLMSDPARLIYGKAESSLFVQSFLKNFVLENQSIDILHDFNDLEFSPRSTFQRELLLAQALAESFMARYDNVKIQKSSDLLGIVFTTFPNYLDYADLNLLHNLTFLKDVSFYLDLEPFTTYDEHIEIIGEMLLKKESNNPYAHVYMGTYYDRKGEFKKAKHHFNEIINAKNFSPNWYTVEAEQWMESHSE